MLLPKPIYSFTLEVKTPQQHYEPKDTFGCMHLEKNYIQTCSKSVASSERKHPSRYVWIELKVAVARRY